MPDNEPGAERFEDETQPDNPRLTGAPTQPRPVAVGTKPPFEDARDEPTGNEALADIERLQFQRLDSKPEP